MNLNDGFNILAGKDFQERIDKNIPRILKKVLERKIKYFANNPYHPSLNTKPYSVSDKTLKRLEIDAVFEFYIDRKKYRCIFYVRYKAKEIILADAGTHDYIKRKYG